MTEAKHTPTPGPWESYGAAIAPSNGGSDICYMGELPQYAGDTGTPCKNHEANAALIAASPDMLEALEKVRAFSSGIERGEEPFMETVQDITRTALAAIAKARGQS